MSVKKLLVLAAGLTVIGATAAIAGGPDHMAMPAQPAFQNSIYIDAQLGYASVNNDAFNVLGNLVNNNKNGGFTGGVDMGYTFTRNIALEAGWLYLPNTGFAHSTAPVFSGQVRSWLIYAAAKFSAEVMENLDLFAKTGVGYRDNNLSINGNNSSGGYWLPLMAAGLEYTYGSWLFGAQYTFITGNGSSSIDNNGAKANLYTGFVGYKFNV